MKRSSRSRTPTKLRYIPEAAYARGAETRARLIDAAIRLFGEHGFEAASTREIASAASLNTPALQYYFNNKQGLFLACAEVVVGQAWAAMKDVVVAAEKMLVGRAQDARLIEGYCSVQNRLADFLGGGSGDWLLWIAREQLATTGSDGFVSNHPRSKRITNVSRAIVARLLRRPLRDSETIVHDMTLMGHPVHFYLARRRAADLLSWKNFDANRLAVLKRVTEEHSVAALRAIIELRDKAAPRRRGSSGYATAPRLP